MGLYFCRWPDRVSLLIHAASPGDAVELARGVANAAPSSVSVLPAFVFVAEVFDDDEHFDEPTLVVVPVPQLADLLAELEDAPEAPPPLTAAMSWCPAEAEDDSGAVVACEGTVGHQGQHRSGGLVWS